MATLVVSAQSPPVIQWQRNLGGTLTDIGASIEQTSDGGYILCGTSLSNNGDVSGNNGNEDIWVVKLDATGTIEWQRCLGGSQPDNGKRAFELPGGGYLVLGSTRSNNGDVSGNHGMMDLWLARLASNGSLLWQRCYGGSMIDAPNDIKATPDGGFIIVGESRSSDGDLTTNAGSTDYWVLKLDANYDILWQRSYGGSSGEVAVAVTLTLDGGYMINGFSSSNDGNISGALGFEDYWVLKLDAQGNILGQRPCGGSDPDLGRAIMGLSDGSFIAMGLSSSQDGDVSDPRGLNDIWTVRLTELGEMTEDRSYGGSNSDSGTDLIGAPDGGIVYCGSSASNDGDVPGNQGLFDAWIFRTGSDGNILWNLTLGGSQSDSFSKLLTTNDGGYIAIGSSNSSDGNLPGNQGGTDIWVVKFGPDPLSIVETLSADALRIFPNPSSDMIHVTSTLPDGYHAYWQIMDAQGRFVDSGLATAKTPINVANLAHGSYTLLFEYAAQRMVATFVRE
jgi:hypothetical protein